MVVEVASPMASLTSARGVTDESLALRTYRHATICDLMPLCGIPRSRHSWIRVDFNCESKSMVQARSSGVDILVIGGVNKQGSLDLTVERYDCMTES